MALAALGEASCASRRSGARHRVVAVNDVADAGTLAALLATTPSMGRFPATVGSNGAALAVAGNPIRALAEPTLSNLPWGELEVDVVIESTGVPHPCSGRRHLAAGASKVISPRPERPQSRRTRRS